MSSWAARMHRHAANLGSVVTSCGHPDPGPYPHRLEKVKFGIPLDEVCKNDIPGPLLVLILKLNKEAPQRKDVFRAPGHQGAIKKLIHFLQAGRLVNVDNYSVYTIASVLKKFLRKIPGGVFGRQGEAELFAIVDIPSEDEQQERIHRLLMSLPVHTQRLLVLLFGTFRVIASNAERADTGMTSEALGVSVAPSFFHSCVSDGKTARMEDVLRFKVATRIMKQMIEQFTTFNLFGRENYEYYARVTGRVLRVQDEWIISFRYPPLPRGKFAQQNYALQLSLETEKTWLQCECDRWGLIQEESHSTPALLTAGGPNVGNSAMSLGIIPEHSLLESCARLSVSLEGPSIFTGTTTNQSSCSSSLSGHSSKSGSHHHMTLEELRAVNRYAEIQLSLETEKTWLQCECDRWGLIQEESHSTPALLTAGGPNVGNSAMSLGIIPEHSLLESCARLSVSLEGPSIFYGHNNKSI
uniref:Putative rho gtpase-activating protein 20 n=1 Tax=Lutzomyia longipalpis TaxID=7200 RepID=A0A7G3AUZ8_LUTLO